MKTSPARKQRNDLRQPQCGSLEQAVVSRGDAYKLSNSHVQGTKFSLGE